MSPCASGTSGRSTTAVNRRFSVSIDLATFSVLTSSSWELPPKCFSRNCPKASRRLSLLVGLSICTSNILKNLLRKDNCAATMVDRWICRGVIYPISKSLPNVCPHIMRRETDRAGHFVKNRHPPLFIFCHTNLTSRNQISEG